MESRSISMGFDIRGKGFDYPLSSKRHQCREEAVYIARSEGISPHATEELLKLWDYSLASCMVFGRSPVMWYCHIEDTLWKYGHSSIYRSDNQPPLE